jgi:hypothetical protein
MADELKQGDNVEWKSSQGTVEGTVKQKLTEETKIKGHHVAASEENPEYLVESDKTGAEAAHKPDSLKKVGGKSDKAESKSEKKSDKSSAKKSDKKKEK